MLANVNSYYVRRIAQGVLTIFLVVTLAFFLIRLTGDPALLVAGGDITDEQLAAVRAELGTDQPFLVQYIDYMGGALTGDLGTSLFENRPAVDVVMDRLPATLLLAGLSFVVGTLIAAPLGIWAALKPNSIVDGIARVVAVIGQTVPVFWLGILLIIFFSVQLRILPSGGAGTWQHLVMPTLSLSVLTTPIVMRVLRSSLLEVLSSDYIRMAYSKGASTARVVIKHGLRNAAVPVITVMGYRLGYVIGGTVVTETVYSYPGLGTLAVGAVQDRDFPVIQTFLITVAIMIVVINLILDFLYSVIDTRIKYTS